MSENGTLVEKFLVSFCVVALLALAGIAQADTGRGCGENFGKHQRHDFVRLVKKLGLSDDQKIQAKAIFQANRDVVAPLHANLRAERKNLQAVMHADTLDEAAIRAETIKVAAIQADLNVNRAKMGAQFRAILTPAQLATLKTMKQRKDGTALPAPSARPE
jgi:protein CpxP